MVECIRRWSKENEITVFGWEGTQALFEHQQVTGIHHESWKCGNMEKWGFAPLFAAQTWNGWHASKHVKLHGNPPVLISSSDFPPDSWPALRIKRQQPDVFWIASFYLFAPSVLQHFMSHSSSPGLKFCSYRPVQQWTLRRILHEADMILVTGEEDREKIIGMGRDPDSVFAVRGGVDLTIPALVPEPDSKEYDAVFIGRLHPQKGVRELMQIWKHVENQRHGSKLAVIGTGQLESELRNLVKTLGLENCVFFHGFKDGIEKYKVIRASRLVMHPAIYDSGGMAAAEALACGLPGVAFDLPSLQTYYPRGFLKAKPGNLDSFTENILRLLNDKDLYRKMKSEALSAGKEWDWNIRAAQMLKAISRQLGKSKNNKASVRSSGTI